jgi:hypothetical protein
MGGRAPSPTPAHPSRVARDGERKRAGRGSVTVVNLDAGRLEVARSLGATAIAHAAREDPEERVLALTGGRLLLGLPHSRHLAMPVRRSASGYLPPSGTWPGSATADCRLDCGRLTRLWSRGRCRRSARQLSLTAGSTAIDLNTCLGDVVRPPGPVLTSNSEPLNPKNLLDCFAVSRRSLAPYMYA